MTELTKAEELELRINVLQNIVEGLLAGFIAQSPHWNELKMLRRDRSKRSESESDPRLKARWLFVERMREELYARVDESVEEMRFRISQPDPRR